MKATQKEDLDTTNNYVEEMLIVQSFIMGVTEDCDTYLSQGYANHLIKVHLCLIRHQSI